jgi:hypothetical protein
MTDKLAKVEVVEATIPPMDLVVLARDPHEMEIAQAKLIGWAQGRLMVLAEAVAEAKENLALAKKGKYKTKPWEAVLHRAERRFLFYTKLKAALEAGYCIMPDMNMTTIAVRTDRLQPPKAIHNGGIRSLPDVRAREMPVGQGRYVNPNALGDEWTEKVTEKRSDGSTYQRDKWLTVATGFDDIDFPFHLVKPQVLQDTTKALEMRIFDEIGVLPQTGGQRRTRDPIVVGRVIRREGREVHAVSFLISWWIDTKDL